MVLGLFTLAKEALPWAPFHNRPLRTSLLQGWDKDPQNHSQTVHLSRELELMGEPFEAHEQQRLDHRSLAHTFPTLNWDCFCTSSSCVRSWGTMGKGIQYIACCSLSLCPSMAGRRLFLSRLVLL
ncbi:hypothetical protein FKM82_027791 [Ascaphus truei]